jgi:AcrR family transcriptional regulator
VSLTDLLSSRRPARADARRNFDLLLDAARDSFAEFGTDASLEEIARRAGVGIGTLYRNFPTRDDLIEAVYINEVDEVSRYADTLAGLEPWEALEAWLRRFSAYASTKHTLIDALNRDSEAFKACRGILGDASQPLLERAQAEGTARTGIDADDMMRLIAGIAGVTFTSDDQRERVLELALAGIRL